MYTSILPSIAALEIQEKGRKHFSPREGLPRLWMTLLLTGEKPESRIVCEGEPQTENKHSESNNLENPERHL